MPPKPKAETPALLGEPLAVSGQSLASVGTKKGLAVQSTVSLGVEKPALGGIVL